MSEPLYTWFRGSLKNVTTVVFFKAWTCRRTEQRAKTSKRYIEQSKKLLWRSLATDDDSLTVDTHSQDYLLFYIIWVDCSMKKSLLDVWFVGTEESLLMRSSCANNNNNFNELALRRLQPTVLSYTSQNSYTDYNAIWSRHETFRIWYLISPEHWMVPMTTPLTTVGRNPCPVGLVQMIGKPVQSFFTFNVSWCARCPMYSHRRFGAVQTSLVPFV
jgi:hypothetical protein